MTEEDLASMKELSKELRGKTVVLSPRNSFFSDADNQYTLYAYGEKETENSSDRVEIKSGWKLYSTMLAIRHGLLRVLDGEKDVTATFGGAVTPEEGKQQPVVADVPEKTDPEDIKDRRLSMLLSDTREAEVMKGISTRALTYEDLERLLELEKKGENPTYAPRRAIVDGITELMKNTPGLGRAGKINDEAEAVVTTNKA